MIFEEGGDITQMEIAIQKEEGGRGVWANNLSKSKWLAMRNNVLDVIDQKGEDGKKYMWGTAYKNSVIEMLI